MFHDVRRGQKEPTHLVERVEPYYTALDLVRHATGSTDPRYTPAVWAVDRMFWHMSISTGLSVGELALVCDRSGSFPFSIELSAKEGMLCSRLFVMESVDRLWAVGDSDRKDVVYSREDG